MSQTLAPPPDAIDLVRQLWGAGDLENRVKRAVRDVFRLPLEQQSYPGSVILRGRGAGIGDVKDVVELRDALREWLGEWHRTKPPTCPEILGAINRASERSRKLVHGQLGRERVTDLVMLYLHWLGATCDHRKRKIFELGYGESFALCLVCGSDVEVSA